MRFYSAKDAPSIENKDQKSDESKDSTEDELSLCPVLVNVDHPEVDVTPKIFGFETPSSKQFHNDVVVVEFEDG